MAENTKENFANEFLKLLEEKEYSKIGINELAEKCGTTRQTFYYHFKNIDEMIKWAILEDTKNACLKVKAEENWSKASQHYVYVIEKYQLVIKKTRNTNKTTFIDNVLYDSVNYYVHSFVNKKSDKKGQFTEFMYACMKYTIVGLTVNELSKEKPDINNIVTYISESVSLNK